MKPVPLFLGGLAALDALLLAPSSAASPGSTMRVSVDSTDNQAVGGDSFSSRLSADGRYVAFYSAATNLVPNDTNGATDVFVRNMETGTVSRARVDSGGAEANGGSNLADMSAVGRLGSDDGRTSHHKRSVFPQPLASSKSKEHYPRCGGVT